MVKTLGNETHMHSRRLQLGLILILTVLGAGVCVLAYQNYESITPYPVVVRYLDGHHEVGDCEPKSSSYDKCMRDMISRLNSEIAAKYSGHLTQRQVDMVQATCKNLPTKKPGRTCDNPLDFETVIRSVSERE